ncbi:MAG: VacJ family lipoprotein [Pseudomonadota bacterium]|nr:VacJ family lipoprotein [Pseudomonadota bacterium]
MRYGSIILVVLTVYTTGCAHHRSAGTPSGEQQPALSSPYHGETVPLPAKQKLSGGENDKQALSDKDLDTLYEEAEAGVVQVADPIAPLNRAMFYFNDKFYFWILKPVAKGYRYVVPAPVRIGVKSFFYNLTTPVRLVNCVLQGKLSSAGRELTRFVINTTAGMLGFVDLGQKYPELSTKEEDLGQTFGTYGITNGFYVVWPIIGPSTLRDSVGMLGDLFLNPVTYVRPAEASIGITAYEKVNDTSFRIGDYEAIKDASLDPYSAIRDAYIQYRKKKMQE